MTNEHALFIVQPRAGYPPRLSLSLSARWISEFPRLINSPFLLDTCNCYPPVPALSLPLSLLPPLPPWINIYLLFRASSPRRLRRSSVLPAYPIPSLPLSLSRREYGVSGEKYSGCHKLRHCSASELISRRVSPIPEGSRRDLPARISSRGPCEICGPVNVLRLNDAEEGSGERKARSMLMVFHNS